MVAALAPEHVHWVRREHALAAGGTATLRRLARDLPATGTGPVAERVALLDLATVVVEPWEEVVDPGGGEVEDFVACATEVVDQLAATLV